MIIQKQIKLILLKHDSDIKTTQIKKKKVKRDCKIQNLISNVKNKKI